MKKNCFTMTEMLVVVIVVSILAALGAAVAISALAKAELTNCAANQGQIGKVVISAIQKNDGRLISSSSGDDLWVTALYEKRLINSLDEVRCPSLTYTKFSIEDDDARMEAYGMFTASSGKFNFKNNKLRRTSSGIEIAPSNILLGGCCAKDFKDAAAVATLDDNGGKLIAIHRGEVINTFFLDGSVTSLEAEVFEGKNFFRPAKDGSGAEEFDEDILREE